MESEKKLILDVNESPKKVGQWIILAVQHLLAMFVACITVPLIVFNSYVVGQDFANAGAKVSYVGLNGQSFASALIAPTLVAAGIGTLIYILLTKMKSPVFLASSFAYIAPMCAAISLGSVPLMKDATGALVAASEGASVVAAYGNIWALPIGMALVGLVYVAVALVVKFAGVAWLNKLLPTIVIGPVIMVIGLGLSGSAISNLTTGSGNDMSYNLIAILCGLIAMAVTAICAHYGKKTVSLIPFVLGMCAGYVAAALFTAIGYAAKVDYLKIVDFSPVVNNWSNVSVKSFIAIPDFLFLATKNPVAVQPEHLGTIALLFIPVSLVTICEHIGDHKNLSGIIGRDLLEEPGLSRTLMGDGIATAASGILCGAANTTYGENVAVVGVTKIASVKVIILACIMTILLAFLSPIMTIVQTIPACVTGGVSLVLYGFIASSGVKMLINEKVDFGNTKNIFVASAILVAGIGGLAISFAAGNTTITVTSTAVAMILGIIMNLILKDKKPAEKAEKVEESKAE
ncbi:MAG: solute carrier family 23 protein [Candidatus Enteromonas sp.]|nr:solute carrier family 23 protein [Candidatus Enteromonas sp.]